MIFLWEGAKRLLEGIWGYVVTGLAVLLAVLVALAKAKKAGRDEVIADSAVKEVEHAKKANEIDRDVATSKPDDVRERLRKYERP
jgi:hypothetical protein